MSHLSFVSPLPLQSSTQKCLFASSKCVMRNPVQLPRVAMTCAPLHPRQQDNTLPRSFRFTDPLKLAHLELGAGNPKAAVVHFESHLADSPEDGRIWLQLAKAVRSYSGPARAVDIMRRAIAALPSSPYVWHFYAELVQRTAGTYRARAVLREAIKNCPKNAALLCACAVAEANLSDHRAASALFEAAVWADARDHVTYLKWAAAEQARRKYHLARQVYRRAAENVHRQRRAMILTSHAGMEAKIHRFQDARALYERAAVANPNDKLVWQPWACMEQRAGNIDRARQLFERAVLVDPKFTSCWQAWGLLEQAAGNLDSARALFERGTLADPVDPLCWQAWASLEAENGNVLEAHRLFQEGADRLTPDRRAATLYMQWARVDESMGDVDNARARFRAALARGNEKRDDVIRILHAWAGLERRADEIVEARALYRRALSMNHRDFRTMHGMAMLELQAGDFEGARQLLLRCVRVAPKDAASVRALAEVECQHFADSGGVLRARALLKRATAFRRRNESLLEFWADMERSYGDVEVAERLREQLAEREDERPALS